MKQDKTAVVVADAEEPAVAKQEENLVNAEIVDNEQEEQEQVGKITLFNGCRCILLLCNFIAFISILVTMLIFLNTYDVLIERNSYYSPIEYDAQQSTDFAIMFVIFVLTVLALKFKVKCLFVLVTLGTFALSGLLFSRLYYTYGGNGQNDFNTGFQTYGTNIFGNCEGLDEIVDRFETYSNDDYLDTFLGIRKGCYQGNTFRVISFIAVTFVFFASTYLSCSCNKKKTIGN